MPPSEGFTEAEGRAFDMTFGCVITGFAVLAAILFLKEQLSEQGIVDLDLPEAQITAPLEEPPEE